MFYSQCLLSRKGPLGAIWVAAYCFKKLKKAQVKETDISSSVDKILQDEWDVVAYRVLAYLLLGVVRIYSKKVEYLFDDCNEVLIKINKFVVSTKENSDGKRLRAPYYSVTLPDRFELDAFDLGILEDVSGGNVMSQEDITLKDCAKGNGIGQLSLEMYDYEEFGFCNNMFSADYTPVQDVLSSHLMDINMELRTSSSGANSEAIMEKLRENRFSQEECADLEIFYGVEAEPLNQVKPFGEDNETNAEQIKAPDIVLSEDGIQGGASLEKLQDVRFSEEECVNLETCYGIEREPSYHVITSGDDHQIDQEEIMEPELVQPENQLCQIMIEDHLSNLEDEMEKLQNCTFSQEEYMDLDKFCGDKQPEEHVCSFGEENHVDGEPKKLPEMISPNNIECKIIAEEDPDPLSIAYDGTPDAQLPDAFGATTPKFMFIPTPAAKESVRISRKRKCVIDDMIVLPNEVVRQSIHDASDLVSKRRKVPQTALAAWKDRRIGNLSLDFLEPLIHGVSQELKSLFCKSKLRITESSETVGPPEKLDVLRSRSVGRSEQIAIAPDGPPEKLDVLESPSVGRSEQIAIAPDGLPEKLDVLESPSVGRSEQIAIAPETPVLRSTSVKLFESPRTPDAPHMDIVRHKPSGRIEKELSLGREPTDLSRSVEEVQSLDRDQERDFNFLNEEINLCEGVNPELDGWSGRTRMVARYLHKQFPNRKTLGEEEVSLLQVSEGRTKKESARLFYEILVLKTKGYVDVKQNDAYGDILIWKQSKWDQTWGDDMVNRATSETMHLCAP